MTTMATKKELIQALTDKGLAADSLKGLTNAKLEELLESFGDSEIDVEATLEANETAGEGEAPETNPIVDEVQGDVVEEFTQQLTIFGQFIYNARNEDVTLIVENLGYGDVYVSEQPDVRVGNEEQRLLFKEQRAFKASRLHFTAGSQPVVQIIEIK